MKKMILSLMAMLTVAVSASAMSYEQAREEALFLTDKMAYELNLSDAQYEAAFEINLDYLMGVTTVDDVYGPYWERRNLDMSYILFEWQLEAYRAATYFLRPLYWDAGFWHFAIYARYPHRSYFYFGRPHFFATYHGGHSWHMNGGRSFYQGRLDHYRPGGMTRDQHFGMRNGWDRGDYRGGGGRNSSTHITGGRGNNYGGGRYGNNNGGRYGNNNGGRYGNNNGGRYGNNNGGQYGNNNSGRYGNNNGGNYGSGRGNFGGHRGGNNSGNNGYGGHQDGGSGHSGGSFSNGSGRGSGSFNNGSGRSSGSFNNGSGRSSGSFNNGSGRSSGSFNNGSGRSSGSFNNGSGRSGGSSLSSGAGHGSSGRSSGSFNSGTRGGGGSSHNSGNQNGGGRSAGSRR